MDNKNVFVAIALSMSVLLFWGAFFETPKNNINKSEISKQQDKIQKNSTPSVNFDLKKKEISREESIKNNKRINLENESIEGSILLKGALIDDISFKNYKKEIGKSEKVIFLNPSDTKKAYFIETGWAGIQNKIKVPDLNSVWKIKEGTKLENDSGKNLYEFWGSSLAEYLQRELTDHTSKLVVNCASVEYFKSIDNDALISPVVTPVFKEIKNGKPKIISFFAKKARGMMARFIIQNKIDNIEGIKGFNLEGYSFDESLSSEFEPVFVRAQA